MPTAQPAPPPTVTVGRDQLRRDEEARPIAAPPALFARIITAASAGSDRRPARLPTADLTPVGQLKEGFNAIRFGVSSCSLRAALLVDPVCGTGTTSPAWKELRRASGKRRADDTLRRGALA